MEQHQRFTPVGQGVLDRSHEQVTTEPLDAELIACRGIPPRELEHSLFAHRKEIAEVIPHHVTGRLRGVRVRWKPVSGLTAGWMRQSIGCRLARYKRMGEQGVYVTDDPTLVAGAVTSVEERGDHLEVVIEANTDEANQAVLGRAAELVRPPSPPNRMPP